MSRLGLELELEMVIVGWFEMLSQCELVTIYIFLGQLSSSGGRIFRRPDFRINWSNQLTRSRAQGWARRYKHFSRNEFTVMVSFRLT